MLQLYVPVYVAPIVQLLCSLPAYPPYLHA